MVRAGGRERVVVPPGVDPEAPAGSAEPAAPVELEIEDPGDLAALQDEKFASWVWYIWRDVAPGEPRDRQDATKGPRYVCKLYGPLDVEDIRAQCGGGHYKIAGYVAGTKQRGFRLTIDGPPRVPPIAAPPGSAPAPPPAAAPAPSAAVSPELAALVQQLTRAVDQLSQVAHREPPGTQGQAFGFKEFLQILPHLQHTPAPAVDGSTLKEMVALVKTGIELGSVQGGEVNPWLAVIDKLGPHLERIAAGMGRRGAPPRLAPIPPAGSPPAQPGAPAPPAPAAAPASGSSAEVVEEDKTGDAQRWAVAVESLARAITEQQEPGDFAGVLERILSDGQLSMLTTASTDAVMAELTQVTTRFPVFGTAEARTFVDAVLTELRSEGSDSEATPS